MTQPTLKLVVWEVMNPDLVIIATIMQRSNFPFAEF